MAKSGASDAEKRHVGANRMRLISGVLLCALYVSVPAIAYACDNPPCPAPNKDDPK
jgi:hypothetical protein